MVPSHQDARAAGCVSPEPAIPLAAEDGTFWDSVRRPSEAVESSTDGLGGPSYKRVSSDRERPDSLQKNPLIGDETRFDRGLSHLAAAVVDHPYAHLDGAERNRIGRRRFTLADIIDAVARNS